MTTWPDGTPRSTGNAFDVQPAAVDKKLQKNQAKYDAKLEREGRTRAEVAIAKAMRKNHFVSLAGYKTNSEKAPR